MISCASPLRFVAFDTTRFITTLLNSSLHNSTRLNPIQPNSIRSSFYSASARHEPLLEGLGLHPLLEQIPDKIYGNDELPPFPDGDVIMGTGYRSTRVWQVAKNLKMGSVSERWVQKHTQHKKRTETRINVSVEKRICQLELHCSSVRYSCSFVLMLRRVRVLSLLVIFGPPTPFSAETTRYTAYHPPEAF